MLAKTEREAVEVIAEIAKKQKKKVIINQGKSAAIIIKGKKPLRDGLRIVISHIDSPRLDLKQVPLYQDSESHLALFETHYYGGIKKFQWVVIPLALHGVIVKKDGKKITFTLGEGDLDPVFSVPDLLPHLSHEIQDNKKIDEAIKGENLDIVIGSLPARGDFKEKIKVAILEKLHEEYDITEEDFISAELEAVPAFKARDLGFDRSLIGAYGQDDRICAYAALEAILDVKNPEHTVLALFVDKEEIGSEGNASAQATSFLRSLIREQDANVDIDSVLLTSKVISADVSSAVTPNYTDAFELKNASSLGNGVVMSKYTGHGENILRMMPLPSTLLRFDRCWIRRKSPGKPVSLGRSTKAEGEPWRNTSPVWVWMSLILVHRCSRCIHLMRSPVRLISMRLILRI